MSRGVQVMTELERQIAETLLGQMHFCYHRPVRYEWTHDGVVVNGRASVDVIAVDEYDHVYRLNFQVPVKWNVPHTEEHLDVSALRERLRKKLSEGVREE